MDTLDNRQSTLLKRIFVAPVPYNSLTKEEKEICTFLTQLQYVTYQTEQKSRSFSGVFQIYNEITAVSISEKGKMYLINEQLSNDQRRYLKEQIGSLREIADSAQEQAKAAKVQAEIATSKAEKANDKSLSALLKSNKAFIVSVASFFVAFISNLDKMIYCLKMLLSYLNEISQELLHLL